LYLGAGVSGVGPHDHIQVRDKTFACRKITLWSVDLKKQEHPTVRSYFSSPEQGRGWEEKVLRR
jgi:hypothetical protein